MIINKKKKIKDEENDIEIVIGDDTGIEFTDAKDCVNTLRPKDKKKMKVIVPKTKEDKDDKED